METTDYLTIAGAGAVAVAVVQASKLVFGEFRRRIYRIIAMATGLIVVLGAALFGGDPVNFGVVVGALVVGLQAGQSSIATFEVAKSGIDYAVYEADAGP